MEVNHYEDIIGVVPTADVVEGRWGITTSHTFSNDFGSDTDLPGFRVPATAAEAKNARWVITWPVDNRAYPAVLSYPSMTYALRQGGWDQAANMPAALTLYGTNPANQEGLTIPSGFKSLAFRGGKFTVPSGCYVYSAGIATPGSPVGVCDTSSESASLAGKLKYIATFDASTCIGWVHEYESATGKLTVTVTE